MPPAVWEELNESFSDTGSDTLQSPKQLTSIHENDFVSFHLYWATLWSGQQGTVTETKVHALITYIYERNILRIFGDHSIEFRA